MTSKARPDNQIIQKAVSINASADVVWEAITNVELMKCWMAEEEIAIITDWTVGRPIVIKGTAHWVYFENHGKVLVFEKGRKLVYTHSSSLSHLPDEPESYTTFEFLLEPEGNATRLELTLSGFATIAILKHLEFYWGVTLTILKQFVEQHLQVPKGILDEK